MTRIPLRVSVLAMLCCLLAGTKAVAGPLPAGPDRTFVTDGDVTAIQRVGDTVYFGGNFARVGPATGPGVPVSTSAATRDTAFPPISGMPSVNSMEVKAAVSDGSGGWFVGGNFTHVGGAPHANLAHILANDTVDPNFPTTDNAVWSLARSGSTLYLGGQFTHVGGSARNAIAAINTASDTVTSWNPNPSVGAIVQSLVVSGSTVYAGGGFSSIGGQSVAGLAALSASTGAANGSFPSVGAAGASVNAMVIANGNLYVGGTFTTLGGASHTRLGAVNLNTGGVNGTWNPSASDTVYALAAAGSDVYVGGGFLNVNGGGRAYLDAVDATTGVLDNAWAPTPSFYVMGLTVDSGGTVYAAGWFGSVSSQTRHNFAAISSAGTVTSWDPGANGNATMVALDGAGHVFAGGQFDSLNMQARSNLAAINAANGTPTGWNPGATLGGQQTSAQVWALAASGSDVYVGGSFDSIGGQAHTNLAALNASTGVPVSGWNGSATGSTVRALLVSGTRLYAGGIFTALSGNTQSNLGAVSTANGAIVPGFAPNPDSDVYSLALSGSTLFVGGFFTNIGGQTRPNVAAVDTASGNALAGFNASNIGGQVYALVVSGGTLYAGGDFFFTISTTNYNDVAALNTTTGAVIPAWNPSADSTVYALAKDQAGNIVIGGAFTSNLGGAAMIGLGEVGPVSGSATSWRPGSDGEVDSLFVASDGTLYAGGFFHTMDRGPQGGFASFSQPPANTAAPQVTGTASPGSNLFCANGTWTGSTPQTYSDQWLRDGAAVASGSSYTVTAADQGHGLVCRVTASNLGGSSAADSAAVAVPPASGPPPPPPPPGLPPPKASKTFNVALVSGVVLIKVKGTSKFVPLTSPTQIQVGSIIDARHGRVRITIDNGHGGFDTADFYEGVFRFEQPAVKPGRTAFADLFLVLGSFRGCPSAPRHPKLASLAKSKHRSVRHLWGQGKGAFRTVGRFASATIRGTTWKTDDRCDGTLVKVTAGKVGVRDFVKRKTIVVKKGKSYFAKPR